MTCVPVTLTIVGAGLRSTGELRAPCRTLAEKYPQGEGCAGNTLTPAALAQGCSKAAGFLALPPAPWCPQCPQTGPQAHMA